MQDDQPLPHNLDAERALLGALMLNNDAYVRASTIIEPDAFMEPIHGHIWKVSGQMIEAGTVANPITLKSYLGDFNFGEGMTPMKYLAGLAAETSAVSNASEYAKVIRDNYILRRIIRIADAAKSLARNFPADLKIPDAISDFERDLDALIPSSGGESSDFKAFGDIDTSAIHNAYREGEAKTGQSTGFPRLDEAMGGLQETDLIILAGRPAMGKSALATGIGVHVARRERRLAKEEKRRPKPVAFFSLEMAADQVKGRVLGEQANVSASRLLRGDVASVQMEAFVDAERETRDLPFYIDESGELTIAQLKMKARRFIKKRGGMSLMIVDYLQLVKGGARKGDNRVQEVTEITTGLKSLAKELRVPVLALSQLSRKVEERDDKRPILADLRESGSIEQDADIVLFVYREEYYLKNREPREDGEKLEAWRRQMERWKGIAEIIVSKYRHGSTGSAELGFVPHLTQFLPEPEFRQVDPEESRKNAKRVVLSDHAKELKRIMYELAVQGGRRPTVEDMAQPKPPHAKATMIDREELRRHFYDHVVSDLEDRQRRGALQRAADQLRSAKLTATFKDAQGRLWSYLIDMIED